MLMVKVIIRVLVVKTIYICEATYKFHNTKTDLFAQKYFVCTIVSSLFSLNGSLFRSLKVDLVSHQFLRSQK